MLKIRLRQLELFLAVVDEGSVSSAAERLSMSQPSLSNALSAMEHEIGMSLFVRRRGHSVQLTPEGRALLAQARALVQHAEDVESRLTNVSAPAGGRLILGSLVTVAPVLLPRLMRGFLDDEPDVDVSVTSHDQHGLIGALRSGDIHVALTYSLDIDDDIEFVSVVSIPPRVILPADHRLASRAAVTLRELAGEPFILLDLPLSREYFTSLFSAAGLTPRPALRTRDIALVRSLVANGFGFSIMNLIPGTPVALDGRQVRVVEIADSVAPLSLGLAFAQMPRIPGTVDRFRAYAIRALPGLIDEIAVRGVRPFPDVNPPIDQPAQHPEVSA